MSLNLVTLTFEVQDAGEDAASGTVTIAPTSVVTAAGVTVVSQAPVVRQLSAGTLSVQVVATDNSGTSPAAGFWAHEITLPGGQPETYLVSFANGSTQRFDSLSPAIASTTYGPAASGGGVTSFNTRTGAVALAKADVTGTGLAAADVGALPASGGALTGELSPGIVTLTDAATVVIGAAGGNDWRLLLTSAIGSTRAIGAPTGLADGATYTLALTQPASGGPCSVTWNAVYDFGSAGAPTLSTAASAADIIAFKYYGGGVAKLRCLGSGTGF